MPRSSEGILGKGYTGTESAILCVRTVYEQLKRLCGEGTFLRPGTQWKTLGANIPYVKLVAELFTISWKTVKRYTNDAMVTEDGDIKEPANRGRKPMSVEQARTKHANLYEAISDLIADAQANGDTLTIHKMNWLIGATFLGAAAGMSTQYTW